MSFKDDLRMMRHQAGLTQEDLAQKLHVTRQTVSTWETGKNRPNLETLHTLSQLFNEPLEKLLFGEETKVDKVNRQSVAKKIDHDVNLKTRYRFWTISLATLLTLIAAGIGLLLFGYYQGIDTIDRINPFLSYEVGYTKLPSSSEISPRNKKTDGYWTAWFTDSPMGNEWTKLTLTTGENPGLKDPYVMAYHKGSFVKEARIVPRTYLSKAYVSNLKGLETLLKTKSTPDYKLFQHQIHVSDTIQDLSVE